MPTSKSYAGRKTITVIFRVGSKWWIHYDSVNQLPVTIIPLQTPNITQHNVNTLPIEVKMLQVASQRCDGLMVDLERRHIAMNVT